MKDFRNGKYCSECRERDDPDNFGRFKVKYAIKEWLESLN